MYVTSCLPTSSAFASVPSLRIVERSTDVRAASPDRANHFNSAKNGVIRAKRKEQHGHAHDRPSQERHTRLSDRQAKPPMRRISTYKIPLQSDRRGSTFIKDWSGPGHPVSERAPNMRDKVDEFGRKQKVRISSSMCYAIDLLDLVANPENITGLHCSSRCVLEKRIYRWPAHNPTIGFETPSWDRSQSNSFCILRARSHAFSSTALRHTRLQSRRLQIVVCMQVWCFSGAAGQTALCLLNVRMSNK